VRAWGCQVGQRGAGALQEGGGACGHGAWVHRLCSSAASNRLGGGVRAWGCVAEGGGGVEARGGGVAVLWMQGVGATAVPQCCKQQLGVECMGWCGEGGRGRKGGGVRCMWTQGMRTSAVQQYCK
jgi:hypothetical protein